MYEKFSVSKYPQAGFTLIEIIVAITIVVIISTLAVASFNTAGASFEVQNSARELKTLIRKLKTDSTASKIPCQSGYKFYGTFIRFMSQNPGSTTLPGY